MRKFARMCVELGEIVSTAGRTARLAEYLRSCDAVTAALATWLLLGNRPRRAVTSGELRAWAAERAGIPEWLLAASRDSVGVCGGWKAPLEARSAAPSGSGSARRSTLPFGVMGTLAIVT